MGKPLYKGPDHDRYCMLRAFLIEGHMNTLDKFNDLESYTPKKLRTLRNNLNNRLAHFEGHGDKPKDLQPSHRLYGLDKEQCTELLKRVRAQLAQL